LVKENNESRHFAGRSDHVDQETPMIDDPEGSHSTEDDDLPISITHSRDTIMFGGKLEQDYRFLNYRFPGPSGDIVARVYFDDVWEVSITEPMGPQTLPDDVMAYLQSRFREIKQLGGPNGYTTIWRKQGRKR
jgi:hypothetical protein